MPKEINIEKYSEWRDNILLTIIFLRNNLGDSFIQKEKDINGYVNDFKFRVLNNKYLRNDKSLLKFYPESKFYRWLFIRTIKKIIKIFTPFGLLYIYEKNKE
jgi:hypothetical protein